MYHMVYPYHGSVQRAVYPYHGSVQRVAYDNTANLEDGVIKHLDLNEEQRNVLRNWMEYAKEGDSLQLSSECFIYKVRQSKRGQPAAHQVMEEVKTITYKTTESILSPAAPGEEDDSEEEDEEAVWCIVSANAPRFKGTDRYYYIGGKQWMNEKQGASTFMDRKDAQRIARKLKPASAAHLLPQVVRFGDA